MADDPKHADTPADTFIRGVLTASVFFNIGGAVMFTFPASILGQLAGLPAAVPLVYRATVALFVLIFAGAYAWLARQPVIDRPMVALAAAGKAGFFSLTVALWLLTEVPAQTVQLAAGDLVFAALFLRWLLAVPAAGTTH